MLWQAFRFLSRIGDDRVGEPVAFRHGSLSSIPPIPPPHRRPLIILSGRPSSCHPRADPLPAAAVVLLQCRALLMGLPKWRSLSRFRWRPFSVMTRRGRRREAPRCTSQVSLYESYCGTSLSRCSQRSLCVVVSTVRVLDAFCFVSQAHSSAQHMCPTN